jgi:hypothetical protein
MNMAAPKIPTEGDAPGYPGKIADARIESRYGTQLFEAGIRPDSRHGSRPCGVRLARFWFSPPQAAEGAKKPFDHAI